MFLRLTILHFFFLWLSVQDIQSRYVSLWSVLLWTLSALYYLHCFFNVIDLCYILLATTFTVVLVAISQHYLEKKWIGEVDIWCLGLSLAMLNLSDIPLFLIILGSLGWGLHIFLTHKKLPFMPMLWLAVSIIQCAQSRT